MTFDLSKTLRASLVALGAGLASVPPAGAQNLFDMLFGGPVRREHSYPPPPPAPSERQRVRVATPKISAPSYYDYKVDGLSKIDFSKIQPAVLDPAFAPLASGVSFREALVHLDGYALAAERDIAAALVSHYSAKPDFIWVHGFGVGEKAVQVLRVLGDAASHGLDPADYAVTVPSASFDTNDMQARATALIRFEMALSAKVLRYIRDAHNGRVDPNRLSGYHDFARKPLDLGVELAALAVGYDKVGQLIGHHPNGPEYRALRAELETLRASEENDIVVDPKMLVRPGGKHTDMPKIVELISRKADEAFRQEHGVLIASYRDSDVYSDALVPLIKAAQENQGLKPDGIIGPRTVEALAGNSRADRIAKVIVALEQLRWLPADLGARRVFINQPAFAATYYENGSEALSMRVVVGTKANQTSFFQDVIETIDYNPYWGVPQSIIVNEMLPRLREDPGYLDRAGYEVFDSNGRRVPSSAIDWWRYGGKVPYSIRQTPSEANALGELKILFPNKHAIYMHDTPQKHLFERDTRAFSHGCVRLADPRGMAAALLSKPVDYIAGKLEQGHSSEKIPGNIPVYVAYFTAWPDADGKVRYYGDIYDRDARTQKAFAKVEAVRAAGG